MIPPSLPVVGRMSSWAVELRVRVGMCVWEGRGVAGRENTGS